MKPSFIQLLVFVQILQNSFGFEVRLEISLCSGCCLFFLFFFFELDFLAMQLDQYYSHSFSFQYALCTMSCPSRSASDKNLYEVSSPSMDSTDALNRSLQGLQFTAEDASGLISVRF